MHNDTDLPTLSRHHTLAHRSQQRMFWKDREFIGTPLFNNLSTASSHSKLLLDSQHYQR
jgi:hypothetical protein